MRGASAILCFLAPAAFAQTGIISGTIVDEFNRPVYSASVKATGDTGKESQTVSDAKGTFKFQKLPPGTYEIGVTIPEMKPFVQKGVKVENAGDTLLAITLKEATLGTLGDGDRFTTVFFRNLIKPPPVGPAPHLADGKPDLSGFWVMHETVPELSTMPARPWASSVRRERQTSARRDDPYAFCLPLGVIATAGSGKFVQTGSYLAMLYSGEPTRQIFLDGRPHPRDLNPTWQGHSIGHWESSAKPGRGVVRDQKLDTLIVDTVGFNGLAWYGGGFPSTEQLHVVERYRRLDLGHLEVEITIEDSPVLERPWTVKRTTTLDPDRDIEETICTENNKDAQHLR